MDKSVYVFPGENITFGPDHSFQEGQYVALEPRTLSKSYSHNMWPLPQIVRITDGCVNLRNETNEPLVLCKNDQVCQIRSCSSVSDFASQSIPKPTSTLPLQSVTLNSKDVVLDPNKQLSESCRQRFRKVNAEYDHVFDPVIGRYNDFSGKVRARINISVKGPPPTG